MAFPCFLVVEMGWDTKSLLAGGFHESWLRWETSRKDLQSIDGIAQRGGIDSGAGKRLSL